MKVQQLSIPEIAEKLTNNGLVIQAGTFSYSIQTRYHSIAESISILYADFEVLSSDELFIDFHVSIDPADFLSKYINRKAQFFFTAFPHSVPYLPSTPRQSLSGA